jgi:hypothetical protein
MSIWYSQSFDFFWLFKHGRNIIPVITPFKAAGMVLLATVFKIYMNIHQKNKPLGYL